MLPCLIWSDGLDFPPCLPAENQEETQSWHRTLVLNRFVLGLKAKTSSAARFLVSPPKESGGLPSQSSSGWMSDLISTSSPSPTRNQM